MFNDANYDSAASAVSTHVINYACLLLSPRRGQIIPLTFNSDFFVLIFASPLNFDILQQSKDTLGADLNC